MPASTREGRIFFNLFSFSNLLGGSSDPIVDDDSVSSDEDDSDDGDREDARNCTCGRLQTVCLLHTQYNKTYKIL